MILTMETYAKDCEKKNKIKEIRVHKKSRLYIIISRVAAKAKEHIMKKFKEGKHGTIKIS